MADVCVQLIETEVSSGSVVKADNDGGQIVDTDNVPLIPLWTYGRGDLTCTSWKYSKSKWPVHQMVVFWEFPCIPHSSLSCMGKIYPNDVTYTSKLWLLYFGHSHSPLIPLWAHVRYFRINPSDQYIKWSLYFGHSLSTSHTCLKFWPIIRYLF